jgi:hypothetical protein
MALIPPTPQGSVPGDFFWNDWIEKLRVMVNSLLTSITWSTITGKPTTLAGYGITDAQALDSDLTAVAGLASNGLVARTGTGTMATRTITGTALKVTVSNGDGVAGNPTIDLGINVELKTNKDSASGYAGLSAQSRITKGVKTTDDVIIDLATKGLVLKDTQGTPHYWRVTINNVGTLVTTDLGTTAP